MSLIHSFMHWALVCDTPNFDRKDRIEAISTIDYDRLIKEVRTACVSGRAKSRGEVESDAASHNANAQGHEQSRDVECRSRTRRFKRWQFRVRGALDWNLLPAVVSGATTKTRAGQLLFSSRSGRAGRLSRLQALSPAAREGAGSADRTRAAGLSHHRRA